MKMQSDLTFHLPPLRYLRWVIVGFVLFFLVLLSFVAGVSAGGQRGDTQRLYDMFLVTSGLVCLLFLWALAFLLRVAYHLIDRRSGRRYVENAQQMQQAWWAYHRQTAGLVDSVLVAGACRTPEDRKSLFSPAHQSPMPEKTGGGMAIRSAHVSGDSIDERERQLAKLLVLQWRDQQTWPLVLQPSKCYWYGSDTAWDAFVEQMAKSCPRVQLPECPETWAGINSLDAIIDQLQGAPADTRILCAGCHSSSIVPYSRLPAGEVALLWLLGPQGQVRFPRADAYAPGLSTPAEVAETVQYQNELEGATPICMSFSQPDVPELSTMGWDTQRYLQDENFGDLAEMEAMVVQTLAASYVADHGVPCTWLAKDPFYPFVLGVVKPNDLVTEKPEPDNPVVS